MTNDIREKAEALIKAWREEGGISEIDRAFIELEAALRPSRKEIADKLAELILVAVYSESGKEKGNYYLQLAIEELRK